MGGRFRERDTAARVLGPCLQVRLNALLCAATAPAACQRSTACCAAPVTWCPRPPSTM